MSELNDVNSAQETADYLKLDLPVLVRLARAKKIGSIKEGRTRTFPRAAVLEYVESHTVKASPNPWGLSDSSLASIRDGRSTRKTA